jgi:tRNA-specific 2-thiouridylase
MNNPKKTVAVAMSGGVDSSVVAKMVVDRGDRAIGLFLKLWNDPTCKVDKENRCCDYQALADAREVANKLKIPFYVINAEKEFKKLIVDDFIDQYKKLQTPNPCIRCNQYIKFDLLLARALSIGADSLATGHYGKIIKDKNEYQLFAARDQNKDQSYMLYRLNQKQLSKIEFPLFGMKKPAVREKAKVWRLPVHEKPESQEICFFGDRDYRDFLQRYLPKKYFLPGEIIYQKQVIGRHSGLVNYTIGQRKGVEQSTIGGGPIDRQPLYVKGYDLKKNQLIVDDDKNIYSKIMVVGQLNWIGGEAINSLNDSKLKVKIRYRHPAVACSAMINGDFIKVEFREPQRAVTPGQGAVFYLGNRVLGGGIIC